MKGTFISNWSEGKVITACTLNKRSGELSPDTVDVQDLGTLESEKFIADNGDEFDVCPDCHEYILKTVVGDRADQSYGEYQVCSNPDCNFNQ